jgi:hypothetical protein
VDVETGLAEVFMLLGINGAVSETWLQNVATTPGDHSVSVDPISGQVFVPFGAVAGNDICPNGCIGVFAEIAAVPEPESYAMMLAGLDWSAWPQGVGNSALRTSNRLAHRHQAPLPSGAFLLRRTAQALLSFRRDSAKPRTDTLSS